MEHALLSCHPACQLARASTAPTDFSGSHGLSQAYVCSPFPENISVLA